MHVANTAFISESSLLEIKNIGFRFFCDTILAVTHCKIAYASSEFGRCSKSLSVSKVLFKLIFFYLRGLIPAWLCQFSDCKFGF